jgi:hypothetical protein
MLGVGFNDLNGSVLCVNETCGPNTGILAPIFFNLYVGVVASNCFPKRCPFGATTVCISPFNEVISSDEVLYD